MSINPAPSTFLPWGISTISENEVVSQQGLRVAITEKATDAKFINTAANNFYEMFSAIDAFIVFTEMPNESHLQIADKLLAQIEAERLAYHIYRKITSGTARRC